MIRQFGNMVTVMTDFSKPGGNEFDQKTEWQ